MSWHAKEELEKTMKRIGNLCIARFPPMCRMNCSAMDCYVYYCIDAASPLVPFEVITYSSEPGQKSARHLLSLSRDRRYLDVD